MPSQIINNADFLPHASPFLHPQRVKEVWLVNIGITTLSLLPSPIHPHVCARLKITPVCAHGGWVKEVREGSRPGHRPGARHRFADVGPCRARRDGWYDATTCAPRPRGPTWARSRVPHNLPVWQWGTSAAWFLPGPGFKDGTGTRRACRGSLFALSGFSGRLISIPQRTRRCIHGYQDL